MFPHSLVNDSSNKNKIDPPSNTPQLVTDYGGTFCYYIATRDPSNNEPDIFLGFPYLMIFWWNTTTNDVFSLMDDTAVNLTWFRMPTSNNFNSFLPSSLQNTQLNSLRPYSIISSPAFDPMTYTPSATNDTFVIGNFGLSSVASGSSSVTAQIDSISGFLTVSSISLSGIAATTDQSLSFIVPAGASYKFIPANSGIGSTPPTILNLQQLTL